MEVKKILCAVDLEDTIAPSVEYAKMMASMTRGLHFGCLCHPGSHAV